jgi:hypothetical protein
MITATKTVYSNQYNKIALKTFIRGLPPQLQSIVRLRNRDSLEHRYTQNFATLLNNNQRASPPNSIRTHPRQIQNTKKRRCTMTPIHTPNTITKKFSHNYVLVIPGTRPSKREKTCKSNGYFIVNKLSVIKIPHHCKIENEKIDCCLVLL